VARRTTGTQLTLVERFSAMLGNDVADETIDLIRSSLLIAESEYPVLNAVPYVQQIERMALRATEYLPLDAEPAQYIQVLNRVLYDEEGLHGNREDYYDPRNSFLNDVLDRKLGIPITLAVIYMEVARRIEFPLVGVGMPGHFLLKHYDVDGRETLIDSFERGALVTPADCQRRLDQIYSGQLSLQPGFLVAVPRRQILLRMLNNLRSIYLTARNFKKALAIVDLILAVYPRSPEDVKQRGLLRHETGQKRLALDDFDLYLKMSPDASDAGEIRQIALSIRRQLATLN
jgi:regulator of sirC expression with transglutaminase-like and TPR domain